MKFEDLDVWKRSASLSSDIYKELSNLKDYGFRDQITRSGLSISSNIAEGFERKGHKELINFLNYAKGSTGELRSQVYIGMKIGYISKEIGKCWINDSNEISKMLYGLMKSIRDKNE